MQKQVVVDAAEGPSVPDSRSSSHVFRQWRSWFKVSNRKEVGFRVQRA